MANKDKELLPAITIGSEIRAIIDEIIENGGEITPEQEANLDSLKTDLAEKARNYSFIMSEQDARAEYFKNIKALADSRLKAVENSAKNLKQRLIEAMKLSDTTKIQSKDGLFSVTLCKGREKVVVEDVRALDMNYCTIEEIIKPQTDKIKQALKENKNVSGAHIEYTDDYLRFSTKKLATAL